jgi:hypothetical protein
VPAVEFKEALRAGLLGRQTGDGKDEFGALGARLQVGDGALDAADLGHTGEIDVVVQGRDGQQAALLQAPVALGLAAVGGNTPESGR